ncbi:hypothetical protein HPB48_002521 [Haemaphysalis longicornis]|uniref:Uncharacterized protein n=1 Tax=Haemaphysalis longicornis TaxID=44386 RepID=A0A9J6G7Y3_HAELO|nr:hypothetical protein HPB48_002521 [Haemaphysalis longicornis]
MINYNEADESHIPVRKAGRNAALSCLLVHDAVTPYLIIYTCDPSNADATASSSSYSTGTRADCFWRTV